MTEDQGVSDQEGTMEGAQLRGCPFCGEIPKSDTYTLHPTSRKELSIRCLNWGNCYVRPSFSAFPEIAIAAWNRRADTTPPPSTTVPGIKDAHRWITDECRRNRGDEGARIEVLRSVNESLQGLMEAWPQGARFHAVVTVDATTPIPSVDEKEKGRLWQCSGCGYVTAGDVGRCKGYCFDASGESCDAVACLSCGRFHYWTGSIKPEDVATFEAFQDQIRRSVMDKP